MKIDKHKHKKLQYPTPTTSHTDTQNEVFIKWRFHPHDISRKQLQSSYRHTCEYRTFSAPQGFRQLHTDHGTTMNITKLTVAYTRDQNLRDLLIPSRLPNLPTHTASTILSQHLSKTNTLPTSDDNNRN